MSAWTPKWGKKFSIVTRFGEFAENCSSFQLSSKIIYYLVWYKIKMKRDNFVCVEYFFEFFTTKSSNLDYIIWVNGPNSELKVLYVSFSKDHIV